MVFFHESVKRAEENEKEKTAQCRFQAESGLGGLKRGANGSLDCQRLRAARHDGPCVAA
jgi:hypothetical protein